MDARLYGYDVSGAPLPEGSLSPTNPGAQIFPKSASDRGKLLDSFYFELPSSWTKGAVTLRGKHGGYRPDRRFRAWHSPYRNLFGDRRACAWFCGRERQPAKHHGRHRRSVFRRGAGHSLLEPVRSRWGRAQLYCPIQLRRRDRLATDHLWGHWHDLHRRLLRSAGERG